MFTIIAFMFGGIAVGWLMRRRRLPQVSRVITVLIWVLLLCLGVEVGMNPQVIGRLGDLGVEALIVCLGGTVGSVLLAWALWRLIVHKKGGRP